MNVLRSILFIAVLTFGSLERTYAQQAPRQVIGQIVDSETREPVGFSTVSLIRSEDESLESGAVADFDGEFVLTGLRDGLYKLKISFMGYQELISETFQVAEDVSPSIPLIFHLEPAHISLDEVVITGQRDLFEEKVDRTIYHAENDKTLLGGDATDVMRRVPMLSVDMDGNVSMRGSSNILVLIDGRQSAIVASNVADALKQIPAEEIKSVEVITSPSAKYDAEGTGGVINIITKKNNLQGSSLNINSSAGNRSSTLGLNGSLKQGNMGWTLGGFGRSMYNVLGSFSNEQTLTQPNGSLMQVLQQANTGTNMLLGRYNLGWDYEINTYHFLSASVSFGLRNRENLQQNLLTETYVSDALISSLLRNVSTNDQSNNVDANFNYIKTFDRKGEEFSLSTLYSVSNQSNAFENSLYGETAAEVVSRILNNNLSKNEEFTVQLDYIKPLSENQLVEFGAKNITRQAESDFMYYTAEGASGTFQESANPALSNNFAYNQQVTAGYASFTTDFLQDFSFKGGVRYEYTHINANFGTMGQEANIPSYGVWVPSVNFSHKLTTGEMIKAAYNRRVQRPFLNFLNPNLNAANPQQVSQGNPLLSPELTDNWELSYSTASKTATFNFTTYFRNTTGSIQPVRTVTGQDVIFTTFENIGYEKTVGLSVFSNINLTSKLTVNGSIDGYYATLNNGLTDPLYAAFNSGFVLSGRGMASYQLPNKWQIQAFGFARGQQVQLQGQAGGLAIYNLNINKQFNENRGSIGFGFENFLTKEFTMKNELITPTILQQSTIGMQNAGFRINFTYKIGKLTTDKNTKKAKAVTNDDVKGSLNNSSMD
ncbi:MAG: TonB-dependent receptor [Lunatimonas sp.]|uniref:TonB-dependent receptor domain-containing protein n=1 Tax=Lunatimonas sp. TaxID=2060141 RepID=UPI00263A88B2|nr:TonB-dependent receptor [Lunatimonas sp.]MCC5938196.1 TonB-dependent receptor [Lunatimonas sp.]